MDLALPSRIVFNFREWMVYDRLHPPQFFTLGVQDDLLARADADRAAFNSIEFAVVPFIRYRDSGERDIWS